MEYHGIMIRGLAAPDCIIDTYILILDTQIYFTCWHSSHLPTRLYLCRYLTIIPCLFNHHCCPSSFHITWSGDCAISSGCRRISCWCWHLLFYCKLRYSDAIKSMMPSHITGVSIVSLTVGSGADQGNIKAPRHWLCAGNSPVTGEFPAQKTSNAENASIWWRHHVFLGFVFIGCSVRYSNWYYARWCHDCCHRQVTNRHVIDFISLTLRPIQMAAIFQTVSSNALSWMKMYESLYERLFLRLALTIFQHWHRLWLGTDRATSHSLNQWWLVYWRIHASIGLSELK